MRNQRGDLYLRGKFKKRFDNLNKEKKRSRPLGNEKRNEQNTDEEQEWSLFIRTREVAGGGAQLGRPDRWRRCAECSQRCLQGICKTHTSRKKNAVTSLNLVMFHLQLEELKTDELSSSKNTVITHTHTQPKIMWWSPPKNKQKSHQFHFDAFKKNVGY